jgi:hypothetical protein
MWWYALLLTPQAHLVHNSEELVQAARRVRPGEEILLSPGEYRGGVHLTDLNGRPEQVIVIRSLYPERPAVFRGGGSGLQLSRVSHIELRDIQFRGATGNGVNVDDGGRLNSSHHITLTRLDVSDLPAGNHDGIKLSGLSDFQVEDCLVQRWGGSAVDMVGCHRGVIIECVFRQGGDNGVQTKGGSREIAIQRCRFENAGQRGVNAGGSTGFEFFRPPLAQMGREKYEAKDIVVEGCQFEGGVAAVAFVGIDGAAFRSNSIINPERWAVRILQETVDPSFVPSRNGVLLRNLIVFRSGWASGGFNIGPNTEPGSFRFTQNWWYCADSPGARPSLPSVEQDGVYGVDPKITKGQDGWYVAELGSPAGGVGAHAWPPD